MDLMNRSCLPDAIDASDTLLNTGWRPRHLEMHDEPAPLLKVQSLAGRVGGEQHLRRAGGEGVNNLGPFGGGETSMQLTGGETCQLASECGQRVPILGEDDRGLVRAAQQACERMDLAGF